MRSALYTVRHWLGDLFRVGGNRIFRNVEIAVRCLRLSGGPRFREHVDGRARRTPRSSRSVLRFRALQRSFAPDILCSARRTQLVISAAHSAADLAVRIFSVSVGLCDLGRRWAFSFCVDRARRKIVLVPHLVSRSFAHGSHRYHYGAKWFLHGSVANTGHRELGPPSGAVRPSVWPSDPSSPS